jgi:lipid II:glycine glycyltransferase (peptidoglycan interpeptide bridge formation enzyme)
VPANHLLQWEIARWAAAEGYRHYDLGGVDTVKARGLPRDDRHPLWNLYLFKRGFGAEGVEYLPAHERAASGLVGLGWRFARGAPA